MSALALSVVLVRITIVGTAREPDEGTAAHVWQLLMAAQLPIIAWNVLKWLPRVFVWQMVAVAAAAFPVWWFGW
jgi:hypothetical protein